MQAHGQHKEKVSATEAETQRTLGNPSKAIGGKGSSSVPSPSPWPCRLCLLFRPSMLSGRMYIGTVGM